VQLGEDADWVDAELSVPLSDDAWVQWKTDWTNPSPGRHRISVRATDGEGNTQTDAVRPPAPDGATGYHSVLITVS
jgi:hypothetical protein